MKIIKVWIPPISLWTLYLIMRAVDPKLYSNYEMRTLKLLRYSGLKRLLEKKWLTVVNYVVSKSNQLCFCFVGNLVGWHLEQNVIVLTANTCNWKIIVHENAFLKNMFIKLCNQSAFVLMCLCFRHSMAKYWDINSWRLFLGVNQLIAIKCYLLKQALLIITLGEHNI